MTPADRTGAIREPAAGGRRRPTALPRPLGSLAPLRARIKVPILDDILYQAYYDGGVRLVDVSGELLGNLAEQRREIAVFKTYDPNGYTANAPFVMNAMPWKGQVLFSDFNSGLWAARLEPKAKVTP